jgi:hypothetical protein
MNTQSSVTARLVYENGVDMVQMAGLDPKQVKLTQSDIILEQVLSQALTQYQFPVLSNDNGPSGTKFNTEIRLNQQDSFIVSAWGFFILAPSSATDATFVPQSFPSPLVFTGAGVSAALNTLYNSYCKITVNGEVVYPVWHLSRNFLVPQTQQSAAIAGVTNAIAYSELDGSSDGFCPTEPNMVLIGSKGYIITITLPVAFSAALPANTRGRIHYRGLLAQNSTIIT